LAVAHLEMRLIEHRAGGKVRIGEDPSVVVLPLDVKSKGSFWP
jgi:hypothetical protein